MRPLTKMLVVNVVLASLAVITIQAQEASYVSQQINYYVEDASDVYLVWGVDGWQNVPQQLMDSATVVIKGLMYSPMQADGDTFRVTVDVPSGSTIDFVFWINKNESGAVVDLWDTNAGPNTKDYHILAAGNSPVTVQANLSTYSPQEPPTFLDFGSHLVALASLLLIASIIVNRIRHRGQRIGTALKILSAGFALFIVLLLIRSSVIGIPFTIDAISLGSWTTVLAAGLSDLLFTATLTLLFLIPVLISRSRTVGKITFYGFLVVSTLSVLVSVTNVNVVKLLGRPFNYQWLYYSDFLGSPEAKTAMAANSSVTFSLDTFLICTSVLILSFAFINIARAVQSNRLSKYVICFMMLLLPLSVFGFSREIESLGIGKGRLENPVSSFLSSMINARGTSSLYSMRVPEGINYLDSVPVDSTVLATYNFSVKIENVLLIVLESAGAEYFDLYGGRYAVTPNLNDLSKHAVVFENAYAHAPASSKSLVSILCASYPWISYKSLTQEHPGFIQPCISSELKQLGLRTSFFTSSDLRYQNGNEFVRHRAFDVVEDYANIQCDKKFRMENGEYQFGDGVDDECAFQRFASWVEEDRSTPFFSVLWTMQAHYPYFLYGQEKRYGVDDPNFNRYLNIIHHYDRVIGDAITLLQEKGLFENTLVVVVGDHGESFGRHGQFGHGSKIYEENLKVPLIFINPQLFSGSRTSSLSGLKDIAPSIFATLQQPVPEEWQGLNLFGSTGQQRIFSFAPWSEYLFGFREGNMKYIFDETNNRVEIYNLETDPLEAVNIVDRNRELVMPARQKLAAWVQDQDEYIREIIDRQESPAF